MKTKLTLTTLMTAVIISYSACGSDTTNLRSKRSAFVTSTETQIPEETGLHVDSDQREKGNRPGTALQPTDDASFEIAAVALGVAETGAIEAEATENTATAATEEDTEEDTEGDTEGETEGEFEAESAPDTASKDEFPTEVAGENSEEQDSSSGSDLMGTATDGTGVPDVVEEEDDETGEDTTAGSGLELSALVTTTADDIDLIFMGGKKGNSDAISLSIEKGHLVVTLLDPTRNFYFRLQSTIKIPLVEEFQARLLIRGRTIRMYIDQELVAKAVLKLGLYIACGL